MTEAQRRVEVSVRYLRANAGRRTRLDELAAMTGMSKFWYLRVFRRTMGTTPRQFVKRLRVELAQRLLSQGLSPSFVAHEAGFSDQPHLNRQFKAFAGITPGAFVRQVACHSNGSQRT
jgi:AraC-like DNA-binding protein